MVGKVVNKFNRERCIKELVAWECIEEVKSNRERYIENDIKLRGKSINIQKIKIWVNRIFDVEEIKIAEFKEGKIGGFKNTYGGRYIYKIKNYVIIILNICKQSTIIKLR